jgi:hypothetical protein
MLIARNIITKKINASSRNDRLTTTNGITRFSIQKTAVTNTNNAYRFI